MENIMKAKNEIGNSDTNGMNEVPVNIQQSFSEVYDIILTHRQRVASVVDNESLLMVWHVGHNCKMLILCHSKRHKCRKFYTRQAGPIISSY